MRSLHTGCVLIVVQGDVVTIDERRSTCNRCYGTCNEHSRIGVTGGMVRKEILAHRSTLSMREIEHVFQYV